MSGVRWRGGATARRAGLVNDPTIRALLPPVRTAQLAVGIAFAVSVAMYVAAWTVDNDAAQFALGVGCQFPTLLVTTILAIRLVRSMPDAPSARAWKAMLAALLFTCIGVLALAAARSNSIVVIILEWLSVPAAMACFLMATLMRRRSNARGPALLGVFDLVVIISVVAAYAGYFVTGRFITTASSDVVLAAFIAIAALTLLGMSLRLAVVDDRGITVEALFAVGAALASTIALGSTLGYLASPSSNDAIWIPGLAWACVWIIGAAMPYAEPFAVATPPARVDYAGTRRLWPYAVLLVMPPLAVAGVVSNGQAQKVAAIVGFLVVVEVLVARQFLLIGEQRAASVRRKELTGQARFEAMRAHGLLEASLALSRTDDAAEMCSVVALEVVAALPAAIGALIAIPGDSSDLVVRVGLPAAGDDADVWPAITELLTAGGGTALGPIHEPVAAPRAIVGAVPAGACWHLVAVRDAADATIGAIGVVTLGDPTTPAGTAPDGDADGVLIAGFADQLALALGRSRLVAELRADGARIRSVVEHIPDAIAELDTTGRVHAANTGFAAIFGEVPEALVGHKMPLERVNLEALDQLASRAFVGDDDGEIVIDDAAGSRRLFEYSIVRYLADDPERDDAQSLDEPVRLLVVLRDETERRQQAERIMSLYAELEVEERSRSELLEKVIASAENERRRLAHELHDGPVQTMTALGLRLDAAKALGGLGGDGGRRGEVLVDEVRTDVAGLVASLRAFMTALRPPVLDERGVATAVEVLARRVTADAGLRLRSQVRHLPDLPEAAQTLLYRVAQEALGNIVRHAAANEVTIDFGEHASGDAVELEIADDGIGCGPFDAAAFAALTADGRVGLAALAERMALAGGRLRIVPGDPRGTRVIAVLPVARW